MINPRPSLLLPLVAAGLVLTSLSCSNDAPTPARHGAPHKGSPTAAAKAAEYPVIVRVVGRHRTVTVTAGPGAPLYSATTAGGKVLVAAATLEQLRLEHPELYRQLDPSIAAELEESNNGARRAGDASGPEAKPELQSSAIDASSRGPLMMSSVE